MDVKAAALERSDLTVLGSDAEPFASPQPSPEAHSAPGSRSFQALRVAEVITGDSLCGAGTEKREAEMASR